MCAKAWSEGWKSSQLDCSTVGTGTVGDARLGWEGSRQLCQGK